MSKVSELPFVETINPTGYLVGVQDGESVRFRADQFVPESQAPTVSPAFTQLDDTPDSYAGQSGKLPAVNGTETGLVFIDPPTSLPAGGTTGQVLTKNSSTDGDAGWAEASGGTEIASGMTAPSNPVDGQLWIDESQGVQDLDNYIDVTNFSTDYPLRRGETAVVKYSGATSVPLHIKTVDGVYEISIFAKSLATSPTNNNVYLSPNNTTYTNAIKSQHTDITGTSVTTGLETRSTFGLSYAGLIQSKHSISTDTLGKSILTQGLFKYNSGAYQTHIVNEYWDDTTTVWSSLGTITLPYAQSGTILIRRIY